MELLGTPDSTPAASAGADATPASQAPSASAPEASQQVESITPDQTAQQPEPTGQPASPSSEIDFPDDATLQALPGDQRASNWQRLRAQYAETKQKLTELEPLRSTADSIEQLGGWDRVQATAQLGANLFSPVVDPQTNQLRIDPRTGLPEYTAEPFVKQLASESPSTLAEVAWRSLDVPFNDTDTLGDWLLRKRFGLDPALLNAYQQIKSPQDAARMVGQQSGIDPALLAEIPAEFHSTLKSLSPGMLSEVSLMESGAREEFLADKRELMESRAFREEQKAREEQQEQQEQRAAQQRIHDAGEQIISEVRDRVINAQYDKLKAEAVFSDSTDVNQAVWDEIVRYGQSQVEKDATLQGDLDRCNQLYRLTAYYQHTKDQWKAAQSKTEADRLAAKLDARFRNFVTQRTAFWSKTLGGARAAAQAQITNSNPRVEVSSSANGNIAPTANSAVPQAPNGQRFGLGADRINQLAAQLAIEKSRQG